MRAIPAAALLLFSLATLYCPAQTPPALHGVTPDTVEVPERILHPNAIAEPDIAPRTASTPGGQPVFVTVSYLVSKNGDVEDAAAVSGSAAFRRAAVDGVKRFKYQPYTVDGQPRPVKSLVVIEFQNGVGKRIERPPPPPLDGWRGVAGASTSGQPGSPRTAPQPTGPVRISSGVANGMLIHKVEPVYPAGAIARIQGTVILHAIIGKDGTVEKLNVISGPPMLTTTAMDAVSRWRYRPYLLNGDPVEVETTINVNFTLSNPLPASDPPPPQ